MKQLNRDDERDYRLDDCRRMMRLHKKQLEQGQKEEQARKASPALCVGSAVVVLLSMLGAILFVVHSCDYSWFVIAWGLLVFFALFYLVVNIIED